MPTRPVEAQAVSAVAAECSGKWVAWTSDHSRIVADGDSISELWRIVHGQRIDDPVFEKVPRSDIRIAGTRRNPRIVSTSASIPERPVLSPTVTNHIVGGQPSALLNSAPLRVKRSFWGPGGASTVSLQFLMARGPSWK